MNTQLKKIQEPIKRALAPYRNNLMTSASPFEFSKYIWYQQESDFSEIKQYSFFL